MRSRGTPPGHCWEDVLAGHTTPAIEGHLVDCPACARMVIGVDRAAAALRAELPAPPSQLDARVLDAVARASSDAPRRRGRAARRRGAIARQPRRLVLAGGLAAGVAAVAAAGVLPHVLTPTNASAIPIGPLTASCSPADGRLVVAGVWSGREAAGFAKVLQRFEHETGVRVRYAYETRDIAAKLKARIEHGCAPDVALLPQPGLMTQLAHDKRIQPLDAATQKLVARNYGPTWRQLGMVGGQQYGVWFKAADKSTFWYSAPAFRAAGISHAPHTWAELLNTAHALALGATRTTPVAVAGADGWTLTDWFENLYLRSAGPVRYQQLAEHRIPWTDPSVTTALQQLARLVGDSTLVGSPTAMSHTSFEQSVARVFGARPPAAMVFEGDFVRSFLPHVAATAGARAPEAQFFAFPGATATAPPASVIGGDVAVAFTQRAHAARLMRYLATPGAAAPWAHAGGFLSPNRSLALGQYPDALTRRIAAKLMRAKTVRFDLSDLQPPAFGAVEQQGMWAILQGFLQHPTDVGRTTQRLETAASAAWACERAIGGRC